MDLASLAVVLVAGVFLVPLFAFLVSLFAFSWSSEFGCRFGVRVGRDNLLIDHGGDPFRTAPSSIYCSSHRVPRPGVIRGLDSTLGVVGTTQGCS
jgi:hypothetical protein